MQIVPFKQNLKWVRLTIPLLCARHCSECLILTIILCCRSNYYPYFTLLFFLCWGHAEGSGPGTEPKPLQGHQQILNPRAIRELPFNLYLKTKFWEAKAALVLAGGEDSSLVSTCGSCATGSHQLLTGESAEGALLSAFHHKSATKWRF